MKKFLIPTLMAITLMVSACGSDPRGAKEAVEDMGMKDVMITGYSFFGCGENDSYHTSFEATNSNGQRVSGVVCAGIFKGSTVRITGRN